MGGYGYTMISDLSDLVFYFSNHPLCDFKKIDNKDQITKKIVFKLVNFSNDSQLNFKAGQSSPFNMSIDTSLIASGKPFHQTMSDVFSHADKDSNYKGGLLKGRNDGFCHLVLILGKTGTIMRGKLEVFDFLKHLVSLRCFLSSWEKYFNWLAKVEGSRRYKQTTNNILNEFYHNNIKIIKPSTKENSL